VFLSKSFCIGKCTHTHKHTHTHIRIRTYIHRYVNIYILHLCIQIYTTPVLWSNLNIFSSFQIPPDENYHLYESYNNQHVENGASMLIEELVYIGLTRWNDFRLYLRTLRDEMSILLWWNNYRRISSDVKLLLSLMTFFRWFSWDFVSLFFLPRRWYCGEWIWCLCFLSTLETDSWLITFEFVSDLRFSIYNENRSDFMMQWFLLALFQLSLVFAFIYKITQHAHV
jgi:hypothetical protein